ncbi:hypothetical protein DV736_g3631, partial [Chaetothyriales sp. CBS 134916]
MVNHHDSDSGDDDDEQITDSFYYSDDSSFYGDEETKEDCLAEVASFNTLDYWDVHQGNFKCIIAQEQFRRREGQQAPTQVAAKRIRIPSNSPESRPDQEIKKTKIESHGSIKSEDNNVSSTIPIGGTVSDGKDKALFNPYEDNPMAYQLHESFDDFFARLRPSTTTAESGGPWIWIANPHASRRLASEDIAGFKQAGSRLLEAYMYNKRSYEEANATNPAALARKLRPGRDRLEAEILAVAKAKKVTSGKWMLFVSPADVDSVWRVVAKATLDDALGCAAKAATSDSSANGGKPNRERLICVYTENYSDKTDVERVLLKMKNLDLPVNDRDGRGIYYKCDAYSYLDIVSGNEYKLKASMYSSRDFESGGQVNGSRRWRG